MFKRTFRACCARTEKYPYIPRQLRTSLVVVSKIIHTHSEVYALNAICRPVPGTGFTGEFGLAVYQAFFCGGGWYNLFAHA